MSQFRLRPEPRWRQVMREEPGKICTGAALLLIFWIALFVLGPAFLEVGVRENVFNVTDAAWFWGEISDLWNRL